jgi:DNA gyrase subunit A
VAILDMQLRRLAALERKKIEEEYKEIKKTIEKLIAFLTHPKKVLKKVSKEMDYLKEKYGDERRTKLYKRSLEKLTDEDLVPKKKCIITITESGYIKRLPAGTYRSQRRGGKGVAGMATKEEDQVAEIISASTHDNIYFFTDRGKVFSLRAFELPEFSRQSKGQAIINLININQGEKIQAVLNLSKETDKKFLFMATKKGKVKKTAIAKFANIRASGLIAIKLKPDDRLVKAMLTSGEDSIMIVTHTGKSIKFSEKEVREMGRATSGMKGISLKKDDYVIAAETFAEKPAKPKDKRRKYFRDLLVVMESGLGKRTPIKSFPKQKRAGIGVKAAKITKKTGLVAEALLIDQDMKQIIITSQKGQVIKLPTKNIRRCGRNTQGVILMRFAKQGDSVAAVAAVSKEED